MSDAPVPITSVPELLADIQSRPAWDGASIAPSDGDYPRVHLDWHEGRGFIFQCYEREEFQSNFLVVSREFSMPSVEIELGGQALELWPRELFVSHAHTTQAINYFLDHGEQDPALEWIKLDGFPREPCGKAGNSGSSGNARIHANVEHRATMISRFINGRAS